MAAEGRRSRVTGREIVTADSTVASQLTFAKGQRVVRGVTSGFVESKFVQQITVKP